MIGKPLMFFEKEGRDGQDGRTGRTKHNNKYHGYLLYINPIVDIIQNAIRKKEKPVVYKKRNGTDGQTKRNSKY